METQKTWKCEVHESTRRHEEHGNVKYMEALGDTWKHKAHGNDIVLK